MKKLVLSLAMAACLIGSADAGCYRASKYKHCELSGANLVYGLTECSDQKTIDACGNAGCPVFKTSSAPGNAYIAGLTPAEIATLTTKCASYPAATAPAMGAATVVAPAPVPAVSAGTTVKGF